MDAATLHDAISEVCPVASTTVGKGDDRSTWSFVPEDNTTTEQVLAGENIIATIPIDPLNIALATPEFIGRFTNAEYRGATAATWRQSGGNAKNWDVVVFEPSINFNKKKTQTLKSSLVADGILTQARADVIFS